MRNIVQPKAHGASPVIIANQINCVFEAFFIDWNDVFLDIYFRIEDMRRYILIQIMRIALILLMKDIYILESKYANNNFESMTTIITSSK